MARWREIGANNMAPPELVGTTEDKEELKMIVNREIDMMVTYIGRYAALQKRNAVAAVLDFTGEEWEMLKRLKAEDMVDGVVNAATGDVNNNDGALGREIGATGEEEYNKGAVYIIVVDNSNTFSLCLLYHIS